MLLIFGLGYTASRIAAAWPGTVVGTTRDGRDGTLRFDDEAAVRAALATASHVLSSVPPEGETDPVLARYGDVLPSPQRQLGSLSTGTAPTARDPSLRWGDEKGSWLGYLSSTGVYGGTQGAWVDEGAPTGGGRRSARAAADAAWLARGARVFRLPGIYGPGRSPLERVREGRAHRVGLPDQVFSRIHVDDIVAGVLAARTAPAGAYNLADDYPCAQDDVVDYAAALLGLPAPPLIDLASLSPMARGFYAENRRVANGKAKRLLGWAPRYPDYRFGLRALSATTSPMPVSTAPAAASGDQR
ncbi:NAD(P)-dependent oxidoreductase [Sphingomonas sp. MA1305]|uniref:NAD(P)-dependent oxidoreductase n=1 Tax=Sphingomonas sp. MA1305 TaxID=2479204 RepID=UPI0018E028EC|nr:NAD(P)-dependent oxidoreductase [Sphingomonas sp. MA1305]MBI0475827.1 NAD(P)-dependent oxidoreductase [Sphingomonas sp. MA1305]